MCMCVYVHVHVHVYVYVYLCVYIYIYMLIESGSLWEFYTCLMLAVQGRKLIQGLLKWDLGIS